MDRNLSGLNRTVREYQSALEQKDITIQKSRFTEIYTHCEKLLWYIAWLVWKRCRHVKMKTECIGKNGEGRWIWRSFNFPLIHGLQIAAENFDTSLKTRFTSFAYQCVYRTLTNYCLRQCSMKNRNRELPIDDVVLNTQPEFAARYTALAFINEIVEAMGAFLPRRDRDLWVLVLYMSGFSQKDIVFLLNAKEGNALVSEPGISQTLTKKIPEGILEIIHAKKGKASEENIRLINLKILRENNDFQSRLMSVFGDDIQFIKNECADIINSYIEKTGSNQLMSELNVLPVSGSRLFDDPLNLKLLLKELRNINKKKPESANEIFLN